MVVVFNNTGYASTFDIGDGTVNNSGNIIAPKNKEIKIEGEIVKCFIIIITNKLIILIILI